MYGVDQDVDPTHVKLLSPVQLGVTLSRYISGTGLNRPGPAGPLESAYSTKREGSSQPSMRWRRASSTRLVLDDARQNDWPTVGKTLTLKHRASSTREDAWSSRIAALQGAMPPKLSGLRRWPCTLDRPHGCSSTTPSFSILANILRYSSEPSSSQYSVVRGES